MSNSKIADCICHSPMLCLKDIDFLCIWKSRFKTTFDHNDHPQITMIISDLMTILKSDYILVVMGSINIINSLSSISIAITIKQTLLHMILFLFLIFSLTFKLSSQLLQQHHMNFSSTIIQIYTHNSSSLFSTMLISLNMSTFLLIRLVTHLILSSLRLQKTQLYHPQLLIHLFHHLIIFQFSHP